MMHLSIRIAYRMCCSEALPSKGSKSRYGIFDKYKTVFLIFIETDKQLFVTFEEERGRKEIQWSCWWHYSTIPCMV